MIIEFHLFFHRHSSTTAHCIPPDVHERKRYFVDALEPQKTKTLSQVEIENLFTNMASLLRVYSKTNMVKLSSNNW